VSAAVYTGCSFITEYIMAKNTSDDLSAGKTPVSLHHLDKNVALKGQTSLMKNPEGKPWLRNLEANRSKAPKKKGKS
jgi:hypothetical protein